jgi:hypothetical protein
MGIPVAEFLMGDDYLIQQLPEGEQYNEIYGAKAQVTAFRSDAAQA